MDPEFERIAKDILSEMRDKGSDGVEVVQNSPNPVVAEEWMLKRLLALNVIEQMKRSV